MHRISANELLFTSAFYHTTGTEAKSADDNLRTEKKQVVKEHFLSDRFVLPFFRKESPRGACGAFTDTRGLYKSDILFSKQ
jgi:hypothetical protein